MDNVQPCTENARWWAYKPELREDRSAKKESQQSLGIMLEGKKESRKIKKKKKQEERRRRIIK
jgi:hypothetical protein